MPSASKSCALNTGLGRPERRISDGSRLRRRDRTPSPTSARASRNRAEPLAGPASSSSVSSATRAGPALHRLAYDLAYVVEAGQAARRVRHRARGLGKADPAGDVQPYRHPPGPVYPDEAGALPPAFPRNQHIHDVRPGRAQVMAAHRGRSGEQAAPARVQQRRHLALVLRRGPGDGQVHPGQQPLPPAAGSRVAVHRAVRHAAQQGLRARDDLTLRLQHVSQALRHRNRTSSA